MTPKDPIPLSVITGFLGSGKTTLLNQLLQEHQMANTAIIINEFGDISIDHLLVETADEGIIELSDGCLCCTVRGELVDTLLRLLKRLDEPGVQINRIIVETTGLADPAPILHTFMSHPVLIEHIRLDGVITLIDAVNGSNTLKMHEEAVKQVAMADRLVLTKSQLQPNQGEIELLLQQMSKINPAAPIINLGSPEQETTGTLLKKLFDCGLYDPTSKSIDVARWLRDEAINAHSHDHHHHDVNRHDASIRAFTLTHDIPIEASAIQSFLDLLRSAHGPNLLRLKGIIQTTQNPEKPVVIHAVQHLFHPPVTLAEWPDDDHRTRLVLITKSLAPEFIERLFNAFIGKVAPDTPDRQAIEHNPLAIPGHSPK